MINHRVNVRIDILFTKLDKTNLSFEESLITSKQITINNFFCSINNKHLIGITVVILTCCHLRTIGNFTDNERNRFRPGKINIKIMVTTVNIYSKI